MKTKLLLTVACLLLFSVVGYAQLFDLQNRIDRLAIGYSGAPNERTSDLEISKKLLKDTVRWFWEGEATGFLEKTLLQDSEIRTALGVSVNQFQQMQALETEYIHAPERRESMEKTVPVFRTNAEGEKEVIFETRILPDMNQWSEVMSYVFDNALTPEQKQKKAEMLSAFISDAPFLSVNMFEALGLTAAQKQEMENIKKEIESEFEAVLEEFASAQMVLLDKVLEEAWKQRAGRGLREQDQQDYVKKLLAEDPVYKRTHEEMQTRSRTFSTKYRTRLYDVLTDEQWARLQQLIDSPPAHVTVLLKELKKLSGESEKSKESEKPGVWIPGPGAWQPGQGLPEGYRIERNRRSGFPRAEN